MFDLSEILSQPISRQQELTACPYMFVVTYIKILNHVN